MRWFVAWGAREDEGSGDVMEMLGEWERWVLGTGSDSVGEESM